MKKRYHYTDSYLLNPTHPVTVALIGCGGTGSKVLASLAMTHAGLQGLGHPGLYVTVCDGDRVEASNIGRQLFYRSDLHLNKAIVLASRINRCYGTSWEAVPEHFDRHSAKPVNIVVSCVDTARARLEIAEVLKAYDKSGTHRYNPYSQPVYWMDYGNGQQTGQVVLGTLSPVQQPSTRKYKAVAELPVVTERFNLNEAEDKDAEPSCSHAAALLRQDMFINASLATLGSHLLWELLRRGRTDKAGIYLNLSTMRMTPISV